MQRQANGKFILTDVLMLRRLIQRQVVMTAGRLLLCALLSVWALSCQADGVADDLCDIQVDTWMNLYMVMADGQPYKNKRYLTWGDALRLRDSLVADGICARAAPAKDCTIKLLNADDYALIRDGVSFDPFLKLRSLKTAYKFAAQLAKVRLCKPIRKK
jgi:hypothetical protein